MQGWLGYISIIEVKVVNTDELNADREGECFEDNYEDVCFLTFRSTG